MTSMTSMKVTSLKVTLLSDWKDNPYKTLLINHLRPLQVQLDEEFLNNPFHRLFFLPLILKKNRVDILHLQTLHPFLIARNPFFRIIKAVIFAIQVFILDIRGTKTVWTVHEWHDKQGDAKKEISFIQSAILGRFIHGFITHCETTQKEIIKAFRLENKNKVFVVPHGNYIGTYENQINQQEARKILGVPPENLVFLLFGGIYWYKGVLEAIEAFKQLQQDNISLLIAGKAYDLKLKEIIQEKIEGYENIQFIPEAIPNDKVQIYMNACDSLVVPYQVFTTSGVAILGMSYGKACIAPNIGFFSDVLNEYGAFLYEANCQAALLEAMKEAIVNKSRLADMGSYNLEIAEKWDWNYVAEKTKSFYQFTLGTKSILESSDFEDNNFEQRPAKYKSRQTQAN